MQRFGLSWMLPWCAAFLAHRLAVGALAFDRLWYWEEAYRLLIAQSLLEGWGLSVWELQADPYSGGSLVMGLLALPAVALFGNSWLVAKGVSLLVATLGLVAWMLAIDRSFGRRAAQLFGLAWIAAPPLFQIYNFILMGSHAEVASLAGVMVLAWQHHLHRGDRLSLVLWGLSGGISIWFCYTAAIPLALTVAATFVCGLLAPRALLPLGIGVAAGLSPWIAFNLFSGGAGLQVIAATFGATPAIVPTAENEGLVSFLRFGIPPALRFENLADTALLSRRFFANAYLGLVSVGAIAALSKLRRSKIEQASTVALLTWFPAFALVIAHSNQIFNENVNNFSRVDFLAYRVLVPALPALFALFAIGMASHPRLAKAAAAAMLVLGLAGSYGLIDDPRGRGSHLRPAAADIGAEAMGQLLVFRNGSEIQTIAGEITAYLSHVPENLNAAAWRGVGYASAWHFPNDAAPDQLLARLQATPNQHHAAVREGALVALEGGRGQLHPRFEHPGNAALHEAVKGFETKAR